MKSSLLILFTAIFLTCCNKNIEPENSESPYTKNIEASLKDSLSVVDYANLNFQRSIRTKKDNNSRFLRIPFNEKKFSEEFVLLYTDTTGKILKGSIIKLHQNVDVNDKRHVYNGTIEISYLNRIPNIISEIKDGFITAYHKSQTAQRALVVPDKGRAEYPEVLVDYSYLVPNGGMPVNYINPSGFFGFNSGGRSVGYSTMDGSRNDGEDYGSRSNNRNIDEEDEELVDFEFVENLSPIDITKYLKCFSTIPDDGSSCSIEILVDIPVDENPNRLFNFQQGSPGHTFIQITKTNGTQSITQNIGFYPVGSWKMLLNEPVQSKILDNGEHEFNASLTMNITPEQLDNTINHMTGLANHPYDLDDYNCTDFALEVFNQSRIANPIQIQRGPIPGGGAAYTSTPGALYNKLSIMQHSGIESANINLPSTKAFVADSNGPCN